MALEGKLLVAGRTKVLSTKRGLLAQLELLRRIHDAAALIVHEVVGKAYDYERYVVVARFGNIFQS